MSVFLRGAAALLLLLLLGPTGSSFAETGVTDSEIVLGMPAAFTGPSAGLGVEMWRGANAAFQSVNRKGGVHGRKITLLVEDDGYDPEQVAQALAVLTNDRPVFALFGGVGTPTMTRALPIVEKQFQQSGLFYFSNFTGARIQRDPPFNRFVFNIRNSYAAEARAIVNAFVGAGLTRVGLFLQDDAYGNSGKEAVEAALKAYNLTPVAEARYERGTGFSASLAPQLKAFRDAGVDAIIAVGAYQACTALIRDARSSEVMVPIHNLSFVGPDQMLALLRQESQRSSMELLKGLVNTQVVPPPNSSGIPLLNEYRAAMDAFGEQRPPRTEMYAPGGSYVVTQTYTFGSLEGYISARAFLAVLDRLGKNVTRGRFVQVARSMRNLDIGLGVPLDLGNDEGAIRKVWFTRPGDDGWKVIKGVEEILPPKRVVTPR